MVSYPSSCARVSAPTASALKKGLSWLGSLPLMGLVLRVGGANGGQHGGDGQSGNEKAAGNAHVTLLH